MKKLVYLLFIIILFCSCSKKSSGETSVLQNQSTSSVLQALPASSNAIIAISLFSAENDFTIKLVNAASEKAKSLGAEIKIYNSNYDPIVQLNQIEKIIANNVAGIIIIPQDSQMIDTWLNKSDINIPIVCINTKLYSDKVTSFIGSQDVYAGELQMQYIANLLNVKGKIVILEGSSGQSVHIDRRKGIQNILDKNKEIVLISNKTANWSRTEAMTITEKWLQAFDNIDAILAENDEMALGALQVTQLHGINIPIIGIDGIVEAINAVEEGKMVATIFQDASGQGSKAVEVVIDAINNKNVEKEYLFTCELLEKDNIEEFILKY